MTLVRTLSLLTLVLGLLVSGCAPTLTVRHMDFTTPEADIWVDGEVVGTVRYGDSLDIDIAEGQHRLRATRPEEQANPWNDDGDDWLVIVLDDIVLTLLPEPGAAGRP